MRLDIMLATVAATLLSVAPNSRAETKGKPATPAEPAFDAKLEFRWFEAYSQALAQVQRSQKPMLIEFTGSTWCPPCKIMKRYVFDTDEFKTWAAQHVVALKIDLDRQFRPTVKSAKDKAIHSKLLRTLRIEGVPTVYFIGTDGSILGKSQYTGQRAEQWIAGVQKFIKSTP